MAFVLIFVGLFGALWAAVRILAGLAKSDRRKPPSRAEAYPRLAPAQWDHAERTEQISATSPPPPATSAAPPKEIARVAAPTAASRPPKETNAPINAQVQAQQHRGSGHVEQSADVEDVTYEEFVDEKWDASGKIPALVTLHRTTAKGEIVESRVHSVIPRLDGTCYVNSLEGGVRKTFVSDRHKWWRDGLAVDASAFRAILAGVAPDAALRFVPPPASFEAALAPENDHFRSDKRRFVISYRDARGNPSFRIVSGVRRSHDGFSARCHFRWGELRHFLYSRLQSVADAETGEIIPNEDFVKNRVPVRKHAEAKAEGTPKGVIS